MARNRNDIHADEALSEYYRRQYERNYREHLRGTSQECQLKRRVRAKVRRIRGYFGRIFIVTVLGLAVWLAPEVQEFIISNLAALADR